jgi:peptidoglycan/xylan/chitin deacetylase (PgdA/CDA1 family)
MTNKIPIFMYHEVYRQEEGQRLRGLTNPAYNLELSIFHRQMTWLRESGVKPLTIDALLSETSSSDERSVCLTFDDGWAGNYLYVFPILQEYGFRATFFIATELIGKPLYMTWDQLQEMHRSGMSIQSHTATHRPLVSMREEELAFELLESKRVIEGRLANKVLHLSLPHGDKDVKIWPLAKRTGYRSVCTSEVGFYEIGSFGPWLKRISIGDGVSEERFRRIVQGRPRAVLGMRVKKELKNMVKRSIGVKAYRKFYRWAYNLH